MRYLTTGLAAIALLAIVIFSIQNLGGVEVSGFGATLAQEYPIIINLAGSTRACETDGLQRFFIQESAANLEIKYDCLNSLLTNQPQPNNFNCSDSIEITATFHIIVFNN